MPSIGESAPPSTWYMPWYSCVRSIGDDVAGLLDHTDRALVATLVAADLADGLVGEVEADLAEADLLLDLADRVGQSEPLFFIHAQNVERQPLSRAAADSRQLRELCDQAFYGWGKHRCCIVAVWGDAAISQI